MAEQQFTFRTLTFNDIVDVCAAGLRDFIAAPKYGLFFAGLFVVAGWLVVAMLFFFNLIYLAYPLAMGFALVSPFAAVGFYAVSDHLERGVALSWTAIFQAIWAAMKRDLRWMALVVGFALVIWMDIAAIMFFGFMGFNSFGADFIEKLFTSPIGLLFLALGNLSGAAIAIFVFSISAISFPLLYDRDIDFVTAMVTSVRLVIANPVTMILWCAIIGTLTCLSIASGFLGLFLVLPIIGHATWHLYRAAIEPVPVPLEDNSRIAAAGQPER
ncbi:MAG: DUF2189 domain-containing protein [Alphaproteobacteria bacterium]|nr:DUF2189 domain-containing protein [Alphaproteobacteria bacterium]